MNNKAGRPKTTKQIIPKKFKDNYARFKRNELTKTELARLSDISYNTMKKYVALMEYRDDEFYTEIENVEEEFRAYVGFLNNKTVYCPCDSDRSNVVIWLKNNTTANVINTCDDLYSHRDLFERCDVIITNPPFSQFKAVYEFFAAFNKGIFVVAPLHSLATAFFNYKIIAGDLYMDKSCTRFIRPDGSIKELFATWITTVNPKDYKKAKG